MAWRKMGGHLCSLVGLWLVYVPQLGPSVAEIVVS